MGPLGRIGIITGLATEADALRRAAAREKREDRVFVGAAGGDAESVARLAGDFAELGAGALLSVGLAGALSPDLESGRFVVPRTVLFEDGDAFESDRGICREIQAGLAPEMAADGPLLCVGREVAEPSEKARLAAETGAVAVDMESGHLARAAGAAGVPFAVLRVILDPADEALPKAVLGLMRSDGTTDQERLMKNLARNPGDLPRIAGLVIDSISALNRLGRAARPVFRRLV